MLLGNKVTSAIGNQGINVVKSSTCWVWRPEIKVQDHVSKNSGSYICKRFNYGAPQDTYAGSKENLIAYSDSDYAVASLDRKSTTRGCQFLEYIASSNSYGHVLWLQNQLLDYGYNFMQTKIHVDNERLKLKGYLINDGYADLTTLKIKTINDNVRLQALIDGKKVVITKASIRHDLKLNDAEGTSCLPNAMIFNELARMWYEKLSEKLTFYKPFFLTHWKFFIQTILQCLSAKTTSWNEFNSTMASAIICLAHNQKFNFSKYIHDNLKNNLEVGVPIYMFPRFVQVFVNHQISDLSHHTCIYVNPSLTKKVFANMKRVGTRFSRVVTPLFDTMMVQPVEEVGDLPTVDQDTPIPDAPSSSQPQRKHKPRRKEKMERKETEVSPIELPTEENVPTPSNDPLPSAYEALNEENVPTQSNDSPLLRVNTLGSGEDSLKLNELMELCIKLFERVLNLETTKTAQAKEISRLKKECQEVGEEKEVKNLWIEKIVQGWIECKSGIL
nr:hypothetical protein [Tanacetum cinerariifolium]